MRFHLVAPAVGLASLMLAGCQSEPRVEPVPRSAWEATATSRRTPYAQRPYRNVEPPARSQVSDDFLSRERVLDIAVKRDPQEAISEIDRHPLAFPLNDENIGWFEDRLVSPEVVDYLKKRSQVKWADLRKEPSSAPSTDYAFVPTDDFAPLPTDAPPTRTVIVERPSSVVYEYSTTWDPYWGWYYGGCYRSNYCWDGSCWVYREPCHPTTTYYGSVYRSSNGVIVGPANGPVVVTSPRSTTTYRQGAVVAPATAPAGLYNPRGFVQSQPIVTTTPGTTTTVVRSNSGSRNPTVVITRGAR
ncbi:hypothetical protein HY251_09620 [bacterium]|nr:hypothetical protein [bacterium]